MQNSNSALITLGPASAPCHLLLAHGAGAPMTSPFMETMSELLVARGIAVTRFEFAYMAARRQGGKRKPPPKAERLIGEYEEAVDAVRRKLREGQVLLIGGKSMGGRVASLVADDLYARHRISGLVCLGYPFHPPGKPDRLRTAHLVDLRCPTLIVQGDRDALGARTEIAAMALSAKISFHWADDGDHDLAPRRRSGFTHDENLAAAADAIAAFANAIVRAT